MKRAKAVEASWFRWQASSGKRKAALPSIWRLCDPLPVALALIALGVTQFNDLTGRVMAIGVVVLLAMLLFSQVIEPVWRKQCERAKMLKTVNET